MDEYEGVILFTSEGTDMYCVPELAFVFVANYGLIKEVDSWITVTH